MIAILMNYKSFKKIIFILITFSFFPVIVSMESFAYTCDITNPEVPGCCGPGDCSGWYSFCFPSGTTVPTKCRAEEGTCICNDWAYCNSAVVGSCQYFGFPGDTHQCDNCCCTLAGGTPGDPDPWDPPDPNIWYGVLGQVWSDFNSNGVKENNEIWKGAPYYGTLVNGQPTRDDCSGYGAPVNDFSVTVNGENIARAWYCQSGPQIYYFSHHDYRPGWIGLNAGMSRGNYYTATLGNLPSGSSCATWTVYNSDGSLQGEGTGCNASFLFTTVNNYMRIDWTVGPACVPVNGTLSAFGTCSPSCGPGTQTATCTQEASCGGTSCSTLCTNAGGTYSGTTCTKDCNLGPCNPAPIGWHDDSTCISTNGPNLRKINSVGWTCDGSDYPTSLNVHLYLDGPAGSGTFIGSALANIDRTATGSYCGNTINHGFNYTTTGSFPSGTHTVYSYAIDIPNGTPNPLLLGSPKTVSCCSAANGSLGQWGSCSGGSQTSPCNGFSCGGSCSVECGSAGGTYDSSTNICTRNCLYVEGNIWSDDNGNTVKENFEKWRDPNYLPGCSPSKTYSNFGLNYTGEIGNQIKGWWCHSTLGAYYRSPIGVVANIEPEQPHTFTLSNWPDGYKPKAWDYQNELNYSEVSGIWTSGSFTTASLSMPSSGWTNVHWELQKQIYNLTINVKKIKPEITDLPGSCVDSDIYDGPLSDASITVRDRDDNTVVCSGSSNSGGDLVCPVWILQGPLNIEATKTVGGATPETYELRCPNSTVYEYDPGSVNDGDNKSVGIGLKVNYKDGWVSAIDSDIFANIINVVVPEGSTDNSDTNQTPQGFAKTLINSSVNDEKHLGFIFSEVNDRSNPNVDTECPDSKGFETTDVQCTNLGGFSYNLISGGEHDSKWLESFTFKAPENSLDYTPKSTSFKSGEIYNISIGSGGGDILPTSYSITDGDSVAILYVDGNLEINNNFTTNSSGRLLLVVNGSVTISKDVGTDVGSFLLSQDPNIEAGIVASGGIHFNSIGGLVEEGNNDKPIMVSAPLISKESLTFARDLYHDNNATMPAESAKSFNKYLYLLTSLEREKSQDNLYFTGLTTYDLDWEYIY